MNRRFDRERYFNARDKVLIAFKKLRKDNITARANFLCCMNCASSALSSVVDEKKTVGAVYWHRQDEERFEEDGVLNIRYFSDTEENCLKLANKIVAALKEEGLNITWNGNTDTTIEVNA